MIDPTIKRKTSAYLDAMANRSLKEDHSKPSAALTLEQQLILKISTEDELIDLRQRESCALLDLLEYCYNPETRIPPAENGVPEPRKSKIDPQTLERIFRPPKKGKDNG